MHPFGRKNTLLISGEFAPITTNNKPKNNRQINRVGAQIGYFAIRISRNVRNTRKKLSNDTRKRKRDQQQINVVPIGV